MQVPLFLRGGDRLARHESSRDMAIVRLTPFPSVVAYPPNHAKRFQAIMRLHSHNRRHPLRFNMTPMIDVVFLLIIFFLVSSHLARRETQVELDLPKADTGQEPSETVQPRVTVNILPDGHVQLGGDPVVGNELGQRLAVERRKLGNDLEVRIRGDRGIHYRVVEPILLACARAGVWNVTFAVIRREE